MVDNARRVSGLVEQRHPLLVATPGGGADRSADQLPYLATQLSLLRSPARGGTCTLSANTAGGNKDDNGRTQLRALLHRLRKEVSADQCVLLRGRLEVLLQQSTDTTTRPPLPPSWQSQNSRDAQYANANAAKPNIDEEKRNSKATPGSGAKEKEAAQAPIPSRAPAVSSRSESPLHAMVASKTPIPSLPSSLPPSLPPPSLPLSELKPSAVSVGEVMGVGVVGKDKQKDKDKDKQPTEPQLGSSESFSTAEVNGNLPQQPQQDKLKKGRKRGKEKEREKGKKSRSIDVEFDEMFSSDTNTNTMATEKEKKKGVESSDHDGNKEKESDKETGKSKGAANVMAEEEVDFLIPTPPASSSPISTTQTRGRVYTTEPRKKTKRSAD